MARASHFVSALGIAFGIAAVLAFSLAGCPRQPDAPDPLSGTPCEQLSDCNPGVACGQLKLCVDSFCEQGTSLVRPCPGEGTPVPAP